jgi:hypothetical protein
MTNLKLWWQKRHAKHYLNNHWHLILDVSLSLVILSLAIILILVKSSPIPLVSISPINHVVKPDISTTSKFLIVKSSVSKTNIYNEEAFVIKLNLENTGKSDIKNLELIPVFSSNLIGVTKITNNNASSSVRIQGRKIILDNLGAGANEELNLSVTIKAESDSPRAISWSVDATYQESGQDKIGSYVLTNLKLVASLEIKAAAYYNSSLGDQLGSGPIPPMLGLPTNYWVFFEINNQGNNFNNLAVSAKLPEGVTLSNNKTLSAGEFAYNESQKRLTWLVKEIDVKNDNYRIGFEVQLLPLEKQVNTNPFLVGNISYLATDAYTGEKLSGNLLPIDTDLPLDTINKGQGKVLK